eukprot:185355-Hanusia_phi.AAC.9
MGYCVSRASSSATVEILVFKFVKRPHCVFERALSVCLAWHLPPLMRLFAGCFDCRLHPSSLWRYKEEQETSGQRDELTR